MNPKSAGKFKRSDEYPPLQPPVGIVREIFFRLKLMPASLVQYSVEQVTIDDDVVIERRVITERDILPITLSKIEDALVAQIRR